MMLSLRGEYNAVVAVLLCGCALLCGCSPGGGGRAPVAQFRSTQGLSAADQHVPAFAMRGFEPFTRTDTIAIAMREWRLFGAPVDDDDPEQRPEPTSAATKTERLPGLWQRIGEYWWTGQDPDEREVGWTGKHGDGAGVFNWNNDASYAWSAAFISYVMRVAGAGAGFPYAPNHATYINIAAAGGARRLRARDPALYAPLAGDLICAGRGASRIIAFHNLPTRDPFPAHCGLVVGRVPNQISIIGGNVDDAVTLTHVPVGPTGLLAGQNGLLYDTRYSWCVVLQVLYDADSEPVLDE